MAGSHNRIETFSPGWGECWRVWWSFLWRYLLLTVILGLFFGLAAALLVSFVNGDAGLAGVTGFAVTGLWVGVFAVRQVLRIRFPGFRIVCVREDR